jgi:hypothetical protein
MSDAHVDMRKGEREKCTNMHIYNERRFDI